MSGGYHLDDLLITENKTSGAITSATSYGQHSGDSGAGGNDNYIVGDTKVGNFGTPNVYNMVPEFVCSGRVNGDEHVSNSNNINID